MATLGQGAPTGSADAGTVVVTVVIAAFNAAASLARAVSSVTAQTLRDIEVVIVDDGSTDATRSIATALAAKDARVRVLGDGRNHGVSAARNTGFSAARGTWIAVLDADDAFSPERLEQLVAAGAAADMVADDLIYWDWNAGAATGRAIGPSKDETIDLERFLARCITGRVPFDYGQLKVLIRRSFVDRHGLRYIEGMRHGEDFMLYAHALLAGAVFVRVGRAYYLYTQRVGAVSRVRSQVARTIENNRDMRARTLELLEHSEVRGRRDVRRLLLRRAAAIPWHVSWERVYHPLRERRFAAVLKVALRDWRVPPLLARALIARTAAPIGQRLFFIKHRRQ